MTTLDISVDRRSGVPLHRQIYDAVRSAILDGRVLPGQRLSSTRALADEIGVSRLPVLSAYEQLLHEGYLEARGGSGTFVSTALAGEAVASPAESRAHGEAPAEAPAEGGLRPFRVSLPALDLFPRAAWNRLVIRHARALTREQMAYGEPAGVPALREAIAAHLRASRAVRCDAGRVIITSGSQAALRLAGAVLLGRGTRVATEEPGYEGARAALAASGARVVPVPTDDEGLSVSSLARRPGVHAAYVTPSHQYPLGVSMSASRRLALLDWAARHEAWVIEDDYDSEYRYVSRPIGALQGMDAHDRVVYVGTFSKVLFPAVRIGYLVVPSSLTPACLAAREALDLFSPTLYQLALADFLREGHFARHLARMRAAYRRRREALLGGLARYCRGYLSVHNADAGLHVAAFLEPPIVDGDVVRRMAACGLTATPLSSCYEGRVRRHGLLLGFAGSPEDVLWQATRTLGKVLREAAERRGPAR